MEDFPISHSHTRHFTTWLSDHRCLLVVSSYNTHHIFTLSVDPKTFEITNWKTHVNRSMGIHYSPATQNLIFSNVGNLMIYKDKGELDHPQFGKFENNFIPQFAYFSGDVDVHDVCESSTGEIYYISALFSCVCQPSKNGSFKPYWRPPWIDKYAAEDRCHLNGMCLVDDVPRYVTSTCTGNSMGAWRHSGQQGKGVVYDIVENKIVCDNLKNPHSPRWYRDKLWIMESGTGYFGYVDLEKCSFVKCAFLPTFLRGLDFIDNYAVITGSHPRHDPAFKELLIGKEIEDRGLDPMCGIWILNIDTYDIEHQLMFNEPVKELYDIAVVPNANRGRILELSDQSLLNLFYIEKNKN